MSKVIAILTADWHLCETVPPCRTDDFLQTQWAKVDFVSGLQQKYKCPVLHAGDLFDHWKPSPELLSMTILHLPKEFHTVYGNHDLPKHSLNLRHKSGIYTLEQAGALRVLPSGHWGEEPETPSIIIKGIEILVWHVMAWYVDAPYPGCRQGNAEKLIKTYNQFDVIVTGDNHVAFTFMHKNRVFVNPGSLMRRTAIQIDFEPRVYLLHEDLTTTPIYLPVNPEAVSREHLQEHEERNERIEAFISALNTDWTVTLSFEENLERFFAENSVRTSVKSLIYDAL